MKQLLLLFLTCLIVSCSKAELNLNNSIPSSGFSGAIDFVKTIGGNKNDIGSSVTKTKDGGYAVLGYTNSTNGDVKNKTTDDADYFLLRYNVKDELLWSKTYGGTKDDRGNKVLQTPDNGFIILGFSKSNDGDLTENKGNSDFWVAKLDASGNKSWQKSFGFSGRDTGISLTLTSDNGYLIVGELDVSASGGQGNSKLASKHAGGDYWAIKLNGSGTKEWSKFFGGTFTETPQSVIETNEGDFIIAGFSDSSDVDITNNKGTYDFWIVKINNKGKLIWQKNFGGSEIDEAYGICKTTDGNFVIVGDTRSSNKDVSKNNGGADLWVIKINTNGDLIWNKNFGGTSFDAGRSINPTKDGGFIISGSSRSSDKDFVNKGQNDAWILKINASGSFAWQKFIGGTEIDILHDAIELDNGNIIAVGESTSSNQDIKENKGFSDLLIIKIK